MARRHQQRRDTAVVVVPGRGRARPAAAAPPGDRRRRGTPGRPGRPGRPDEPDPPDRPGPPVPPRPVLGLPALTAAAVKEVARLVKQPRWTMALKGASPDVPDLVRRLDQTDVYYALVGFRIGGRLTARVSVDAHDASAGATMGIDVPAAVLTPFRTTADARVAVAGYFDGCRTRDDTDDVVLEPFLVWQPCPESPSEFSPFYLVRRKVATLYYRVDGRLFTALTRGSGV